MKVHGVFPCNHIIFASSQRFQFHWVNPGDSRAVVTSFMHVGTYPTRNFATLGPSELRPPFVVDSFWGIIPRQLLWQRWADVELYTSCYHLARSCVFTKQSLLPLFCDRHWWLKINLILPRLALFFPKLQSQFDEFLQNCCLTRLSMLYLSTCVGYSVRSYSLIKAFPVLSWLTKKIRLFLISEKIKVPFYFMNPNQLSTIVFI